MVEEKERLVALMRAGAGISDLEFFAKEIVAWMNSKSRRDMLEARRYYLGEQDILNRQRTVIGRGGMQEVVQNLPNNRIVDNQYAKLVDQKKNYLLGKPIGFTGEAGAVTAVLDKGFMRLFKLAGELAIGQGIAWLYPYYGGQGLAFRVMAGHEICPFWADAAHTLLDCAARVFEVEVYKGQEKQLETHVELFLQEGITTYCLQGQRLVLLEKLVPYISRGEMGFGWGRIPLIAIKGNGWEIPLLNRVRGLQDGLNLLSSDLMNNMQENVHNTVLVLKNYDGTDLGEFRRNLATYGAVKVRTLEGATGGVDTLKVEVSPDNYEGVCRLLKRAMVENARGCDVRELRMGGNPNQMNIQSLYVDMDLDANDMETELQAAFAEILWFVAGGKPMTDIGVCFNRDMLINESEAVENCVKSVGILSRQTILGAHPWTGEVQGELARLAQEEQEEKT